MATPTAPSAAPIVAPPTAGSQEGTTSGHATAGLGHDGSSSHDATSGAPSTASTSGFCNDVLVGAEPETPGPERVQNERATSPLNLSETHKQIVLIVDELRAREDRLGPITYEEGDAKTGESLSMDEPVSEEEIRKLGAREAEALVKAKMVRDRQKKVDECRSGYEAIRKKHGVDHST